MSQSSWQEHLSGFCIASKAILVVNVLYCGKTSEAMVSKFCKTRTPHVQSGDVIWVKRMFGLAVALFWNSRFGLCSVQNPLFSHLDAQVLSFNMQRINYTKYLNMNSLCRRASGPAVTSKILLYCIIVYPLNMVAKADKNSWQVTQEY